MADYEPIPTLSDQVRPFHIKMRWWTKLLFFFQQKQKFDGITQNQADGQYNTVRAIPELTMLMKDQDNVRFFCSKLF